MNVEIVEERRPELVKYIEITRQSAEFIKQQLKESSFQLEYVHNMFKNCDKDNIYVYDAYLITNGKKIHVGTALVFYTYDKKAYLGIIVVHYLYRGLGIGTRIVQEIIRRAKERGIREICAEVLTDEEYQLMDINTNEMMVRRFFEKNGFKLKDEYLYCYEIMT